jgi:hypothetical protein
MSTRNARRKAKKAELRREARGEEARPAATRIPADTSFQPLHAGAPPKRAGTSFQDLMSAAPESTAASAFLAVDGPAHADDARQVHGLEREDDSGKRAGFEGEAPESSGRLQLGPVDEDRPILTGSGYQPPSRTAWLAAFAIFGIAGAIFWNVFPGLRDIMLPADLARPKFLSDLMPAATDTNALRNTSNVNQFEIFKQGPIFLTAWAVVLAYCVGFFLIIISVIRSTMTSYRARRRTRYAEEYARKYGHPYPQ